MQRYSYDLVSAGAGALACTSFFVAQGQDPWTALSITAAATVTALVRSRTAHLLTIVLQQVHLLHSSTKLFKARYRSQVANELLFEKEL